ncbi:YidH family protein [Hydrogenimonas sp.]
MAPSKKTRHREIDPKNLMALERATASLVALAISLIVLGFVVEKFELFLKLVTVELADKATGTTITLPNQSFYNWLGIGIVAAGILLALYTYIYYVRWVSLLQRGEIDTDKRVFLLLSLFVAAIGVALLVSMILF